MIDELQKDTENEYGVHENVDRDLEYDTIIRSNEYVTEIDNEIHALHKFVKDLYATKYQELEQLVQTPLEYAQVVKIIGRPIPLCVV